jgi:hypothetical protein
MVRRWPVIFCAFLVVAVASFQHVHVPLYDGVSLPDEPYRYVSPAPHGKATKKAPTGDTESGQALSGFTTDGIYLNSDEQGPQIYVSFSQHSFAVSQNTTTVSVKVRPEAGDGLKTAIGTIAGNIYQITASSDDGSATYVPNSASPSYIDMRLPQGYSVGATMIYRSSSTAAWQKVATERVGNDIYESKAVGLGYYALTGHAGITAPSRHWKIIAIPVGLVLVLSVVIIVSRRSTTNEEDAY